MGRIKPRFLLFCVMTGSFLLLSLLFAPVGCGTDGGGETTSEGTTPTDGGGDGGDQPEVITPADRPQPRSCAPQGNGCCLSAKLTVAWKAHELMGRYQPDSWVSSALHPSKKLIAVADGNSRGIRLWSFDGERKLTTMLSEHEDNVRSLAFHPSKDLLASGSRDKTIRLWDTSKQEILRTLKGHTSTVYTLAFFPAGDQLVSGSEDKTVRLWGVESGTEIRAFKDAKSRITSVSVDSSGEYIAAASADGKVYIWEVRLAKLHKTIDRKTPYSVQFVKDDSSGKEHLYVGYTDGKIRVFEMPDATQLRELKKDPNKSDDKAHGRNVVALSVMPDKDLIMSGADDGLLRVWKLSDGTFVDESKTHSSGIRTLTRAGIYFLSSGSDGNVILHTMPKPFRSLILPGRLDDGLTLQVSNNGRMYSVNRQSKEILVWEIVTKRILARWKGHNNGLMGLALSKDGKRLASSAEDGVIKLWDTSTGKVLKDLKGSKLPTRGLSFSPKGDKLIAASYDGKLRVFSVPGGTLEKTLDASSLPLNQAIFSPSGKYAVASARSGSLYVWNTSDWKQKYELKGHTQVTYALAFTSKDVLISSGADRDILWWDLASGKKTKSIMDAHAGAIRHLIVDEANKRLISTGDSRIRIWHLETQKLLHLFFGHTAGVNSMGYDPKSQSLFSYGQERVIRQWDLKDLSYPDPIKAHDEKAKTIAVSPNGKWIATGAEDMLVKLWDRRTGKLLHTLTAHKAAITDVTFSPDSKYVASASFDKLAILWDAEKGTKLREFKGNLDRVYRVRFSPDNKKLATAGGDWSLRIWDVSNGKQLKELTNHKAIVTSVDWSPDGKQLISASYDKFMRVWDAEAGKVLFSFKQASVGFSDALFHISGAQIFTSSFDQRIRTFSIKDKREIRSFEAHKQSVVGIDYHPRAGIATISFDKIVKQWSPSGLLMRSFDGHKTPPSDVAFSPDGSFLYSVSEGGTLRSWPLLSPERGNFISNRIGMTHATWSPNKNIFATASLDNTVKLWDLTTYKASTLYLSNDTLRLNWASKGGQLVITIKEGGIRVVDGKTRKTIKDIKPQDKTDFFNDAALTPDGSQVATASEDGKVRVWDAASGKLSDILKGHEAPVYRVQFSPDGKLLVSADKKGNIRVWDVAKGTTTQDWQAHKDIIYSVVFDPASKLIVTSSGDYTAKIWSLDGKMQKELCLGQQILDANFSPSGKWLALGLFNGKVQIFQTSDWKLLSTLQDTFSTVRGVGWSPDSDQLIAGFQSGNLRRWEIKP